MLPVKTGLYPEGGGADSFLAFFTEEIIPYVDENFRTTKERILYGRSDSGLFTIYALLERPDAFSAYISSSPTVGHCPTLLRLKTGELFPLWRTRFSSFTEMMISLMPKTSSRLWHKLSANKQPADFDLV